MDIRTQLQRKIWTDVNCCVYIIKRDYISDHVFDKCTKELGLLVNRNTSFKYIARAFQEDTTRNILS
jgi:hypothetical protein